MCDELRKTNRIVKATPLYDNPADAANAINMLVAELPSCWHVVSIETAIVDFASRQRPVFFGEAVLDRIES